MAFEVFQKGSAPLPKVPSVTIQKRGLLSLNRAAYALIGSPNAVELLWDPDQRVIGIRPSDEANPNAYPARPQSKAGKGPILVAGSMFTQYYEIDTAQSLRYVPVEQGGILCIDLTHPGQPVNNNRSGGNRTAPVAQDVTT